MSESDDDTRPVSVAELLARNGTLGAPVGGHRRRRRGNPSALSVAELTGEIPIIRTGEIPVVRDDESAVADAGTLEVAEAEVLESAAADSGVVFTETVSERVGVYETATESTYRSAETVVVYADDSIEASAAESAPEIGSISESAPEIGSISETSYVIGSISESSYRIGSISAPADPVATSAEPVAYVSAPSEAVPSPPRAEDPLPRRSSRPERSHDPRPQRRLAAVVSRVRQSGAEQMNPDPVDESVSLAELVGDPVGDAEQLRTYLRASSGTLFSGETVADDLARRGVVAQTEESEAAPGEKVTRGPGRGAKAGQDLRPRVREGRLTSLRHAVVAVLQSILAVVAGAGLFIGFDQLWRWNNIVALVLSVLVILGLVVAVRVVRKTEDIASTLIAVAVGALVTLGPLALLQST